MYACYQGRIDTAKVLIENGAIVDLLSKVAAAVIFTDSNNTYLHIQSGQSPLFVASFYEETAAVKFLLEHGAEVNLPTQVFKFDLVCHDGIIKFCYLG